MSLGANTCVPLQSAYDPIKRVFFISTMNSEQSPLVSIPRLSETASFTSHPLPVEYLLKDRTLMERTAYVYVDRSTRESVSLPQPIQQTPPVYMFLTPKPLSTSLPLTLVHVLGLRRYPALRPAIPGDLNQPLPSAPSTHHQAPSTNALPVCAVGSATPLIALTPTTAGHYAGMSTSLLQGKTNTY